MRLWTSAQMTYANGMSKSAAGQTSGIIKSFAETVQLRTGRDIDVSGAHAAGYNSVSIGMSSRW